MSSTNNPNWAAYRGGPEEDYYWEEVDRKKAEEAARLKSKEEAKSLGKQILEMQETLKELDYEEEPVTEYQEPEYQHYLKKAEYLKRLDEEINKKKKTKLKNSDFTVEDISEWDDLKTRAVEKIDFMGDIRYTINSDEFSINVDDKKFEISKDDLRKLIKGNWPWPETATTTGENKLGALHPKISMISSETGKNATFFLQSVNTTSWIFMPSKGTLIKNKGQLGALRGWIIEVTGK